MNNVEAIKAIDAEIKFLEAEQKKLREELAFQLQLDLFELQNAPMASHGRIRNDTAKHRARAQII